MKIVAVTSCITGIAHTYMAAESLEQAAKKAGHEITVETQGSAGSSPVPQTIIDAADVVVFACDLEVKNKSRFNGKPFLQVGVSRALADGDSVIKQAVIAATSGKAPKVGESGSGKSASVNDSAASKKEASQGFFSRLFGKR